MNKSGKTKDDIIEDAMENYKMKNGGKPFPFKHCLEVLWNCPQFDVTLNEDGCPAVAAAAAALDRRRSNGNENIDNSPRDDVTIMM